MQLNPFIHSFIRCVSAAYDVARAHEFPRYSVTVHIADDEASCRLEIEAKGYLLMRGGDLDTILDTFECQKADVAAEAIRHIIPHLSRLLRDQNKDCREDLDKLCHNLDAAMCHGILQCVKSEWARELRVELNDRPM